MRPTTDRVREAVFNSLGSMGAVSGATVLDLFAGTGALGIEALSRGAGSCTFFESDRRAVAVLRENLARTLTDDRARVLVGDTMSLLSGAGALAGEDADLALADPPYGFDRWAELLGLLSRLEVHLVVAESDRAVDPVVGWSAVRQRSYGDTVVTILERSRGADPRGTDPRGAAAPALDPTDDPHEEYHL